jgi:hypothetical protein
MSNLTSTARAKLLSATSPAIYNLAMPLANTEYSQVISSGTKQLLVRMRSTARAKLAFISGDSSVLYITIEAGAVYFDNQLDLSGTTIYLQSAAAGQVAEILEWT